MKAYLVHAARTTIKTPLILIIILAQLYNASTLLFISLIVLWLYMYLHPRKPVDLAVLLAGLGAGALPWPLANVRTNTAR